MKVVHVEAGARLHFGFLDLNGSLGRMFGGIGMGIDEPKVSLDVCRSDTLQAKGPDFERALEYAQRFLDHFDIKDRAFINIASAVPSHVGLGSGTRMALAVGKALAVLFDIDLSIKELAVVMGRSRRSSVGAVTFERGGFVLDGGHKKGPKGNFPPLLFHALLPTEWTFVVAVPMSLKGASGAEEEEKFKALSIHEELSSKVCRLTLMKLLPSIVERDVAAFGEAITEIQDLVGSCFSSLQGGKFHSALSQRIACLMKGEGALGIGQSSWGPAVYGITADPEKAQAVCGRLKDGFGEETLIFTASCAQDGANVCVRED